MTKRVQVALELSFLIVFLLVAFLFRERPEILENLHRISSEERVPSEPSKREPSKAEGDRDNRTQGTQISAEKRDTGKVSTLARRNPFTPDGTYSDLVIPDNPYTLVAILKGNPNRALVRLFTGEVKAIKEGDLLLDGSKVLKIEERSVIIERLGKRRELKLLHVEVEKWQIKK